MLLSMTGFGEAHNQEANLAVVVEVRAINNRHFKLTPRLGENYSFLEPQVEELVRQSSVAAPSKWPSASTAPIAPTISSSIRKCSRDTGGSCRSCNPSGGFAPIAARGAARAAGRR